MEVDSQVGRGTSVTLWLPRTDKVGAAPLPVDVHTREERQASGSVLLVEDDSEVAQLVTEMLHDLGYDVLHAGTAEAALGGLANGRRLDLMFSDIMMPGDMNGLDLAREVRRRRPDLPVLLTSGYAESVLSEAANERIPVLAKPYDINALAVAVSKVLARE